MCGIAGIYEYRRERLVDVRLLQRMTEALIHRGPDDEGYHVDGPVGLGVRRLSIIDVGGGHQPVTNEDGTIWVVFNGEIYNFRELRELLSAKGHRFKTRTDTETIVHAYEEYGDDCCQRLSGMFAFALWDRPRQRLLLARDHYGIKPLYYTERDGGLAFASEIKAILRNSEIPRRVDADALDEYLTYRCVPAPRTMFAGISKLRPGHRLICDPGGTRVERYWAPVPVVDEKTSEETYVEALRHQLREAVKRQLVSDVPLGLLLSGGVDSSAILAIMSELSGRPVKTFTVGFAGEHGQKVSELAEARRVANMFGAEHHEVILDSADYLAMLPRAVASLDEPNGTTSALALYFVCKLARAHVKVVLTGQGADEPFGGYARHVSERYGHLYRSLPSALQTRIIGPVLEKLPRNERLKRAGRAVRIPDPVERFGNVYSVFTDPMKSWLYRADVRPRQNGSRWDTIRYWQEGVTHLDPLAQMQYVDARLSLADDLLTYGDKLSMATSVEARVPFLDLDLMALAESIPSRLKIQRLTGKAIHKRAVAKWLPAQVINRPKMGFMTPMDSWFQRELGGHVREALLAPDAACSEFFSPQSVARLIDDHVARRQDYQRQIFCLWSFELWHRHFIRGETSFGV